MNSLLVSFVLASSWAEDTESSMNSQFISPGIGGSLLWFFSFTVLFAFSGIFVLFCVQNEEKRRDLFSLAVLGIDLALVGLVLWSGFLSIKGSLDAEVFGVWFLWLYWDCFHM